MVICLVLESKFEIGLPPSFLQDIKSAVLIFGLSVQYLQIWGEDLSTARSSLLWSGRHPSHGSHSPQTERTQAWSHVAQSPHRVDIRPHCCVEFRAGAAWTRRGVCGCHAPKTIIWLERSNKLKVFISEVRNIILKGGSLDNLYSWEQDASELSAFEENPDDAELKEKGHKERSEKQ